MSSKINENLTLGIDLGSNSLGWALLEEENSQYVKIVDCGVRLFEAGMDGDIETGRTESRCAKRRDKRLIRRQLWRKRRRMKKLMRTLQKMNFLPDGDDIEKIIRELDKEFLSRYTNNHDESMPTKQLLPHVLPYYIRTRGLSVDLEKHEFGRALYHLAQRRGFWSNRKSQIQDDDETGVVKAGISELSKKMEENRARTLGEYFAFSDPRKERIRGLWTSREMYKDEFNQLCDRQDFMLPEEYRKKLYHDIFKQRPLKNVNHLIGACELEKEERRSPWYHFATQEFRCLQALNNLVIATPGEVDRELSSEEWSLLRTVLNGETGELDRHGNLTYKKARKLLGLSKNARFTIEDDKKDFITGNKTNANLAKIFDARWKTITEFEKDEIIQDLRSYTSVEGLKKRGMRRWELSEEKAVEFSKVNLDDDYCNLSLKAIERLLPALREGKRYMQAVKEVYPSYFDADCGVLDSLPPVDEVVGNLRNPIVSRCLTEVRKVVNAIINKHGKPGRIKIELARDIKNSNKQKDRIIKRNRDNEKERARAKKLIFDELGIDNPSRTDILKVQLWEECNRECPYTQKSISVNALLSDSQFDIEHIIPFSRSLDNSFLNKTLCYHEENRNVKRNQTPYEAYNGTEQYDAMLQSVSRFQGKHGDEKLRRFQMDSEAVRSYFTDFSSRQLNDTRYASKESIKYLATLYGGISDANHSKRIYGVAGGITYLVRAMYGLNNILGDGVKSRDDHRHHTVDAIAIALISDKAIKLITDKVREADKRQLFGSFKTFSDYISPHGWNTFNEDVRSAIEKVIASHHVSRRVRGALHKNSIYSKPYSHDDAKGKNVEFRHERMALEDLDVDELDKIVDPAVKKAVCDKLAELGKSDPKKAFKDPENLPTLFTKNGIAHSTVKKVRILRTHNTVTVGKGKRERRVIGGNNHHMEIVALLDENGNEIKWEGHVVSILEAMTRLKNGEQLVKREYADLESEDGIKRLFKFSLACGDVIEIDYLERGRLKGVIRSLPLSKQIQFVSLNDARLKGEIQKVKEWFSSNPAPLKDKHLIKYSVTPLGELRRAND